MKNLFTIIMVFLFISASAQMQANPVKDSTQANTTVSVQNTPSEIQALVEEVPFNEPDSVYIGIANVLTSNIQNDGWLVITSTVNMEGRSMVVKPHEMVVELCPTNSPRVTVDNLCLALYTTIGYEATMRAIVNAKSEYYSRFYQ